LTQNAFRTDNSTFAPGFDNGDNRVVETEKGHCCTGHLLTVAVEDYYQHAGLSRVVQPERWRPFEARVERNTLRALDLLDEHNI